MDDNRKAYGGVDGAQRLPPILTSAVAQGLLAAMQRGAATAIASLDLGLSEESVAVSADAVTIRGVRLPQAALADAAATAEKCFECIDGALHPISVFSEATGWVRTLRPTADAPTTVVAGFPMHRIAGTTPLADTRAKVRALGKPRGRVLDTATGLGYTAIELARTCTEVVTVELDPTALELARRNPWSAALFANPKIQQVIGDVAQHIQSFAAHEFAAVLHDPPTTQLAGDLYSQAFYSELRRILRPGGRLFHYVGDPSRTRTGRATAGVMRRLTAAGFVRVRRAPRAFGVTAIAPAPRRVFVGSPCYLERRRMDQPPKARARRSAHPAFALPVFLAQFELLPHLHRIPPRTPPHRHRQTARPRGQRADARSSRRR